MSNPTASLAVRGAAQQQDETSATDAATKKRIICGFFEKQ
jgi:hypothetical protein